MSERILGPTGSTRRRRFLFIPLVLITCTALLYIAGAQAVGNPQDSGLFQLDGNTLPTDCASPFPSADPFGGDDWAGLYTQLTTNLDLTPCGSDAFTFVPDGTGTADTTYWSQGGSKDAYDPALGPWLWKPNDVSPDKNDLVNAFAAIYHLGSGPSLQRFLYFGSDRFDTSGDAQQGFQFLQARICLAGGTAGSQGIAACPPSTPSLPTGCTPAFSGTSNAGYFVDPDTGCPVHHRNGDLLILVNFNKGGTLGLAAVYEWFGADGAGAGCYGNGTVCDQPAVFGEGANCASITTPNDFCSIANTGPLSEPIWAYTAKGGGTTYDTSAFIEGGVNLSRISGAGSCFPSFIAESRSSSGPGSGLSLQAQLKDLAFGKFQLCQPNISITPDDVNEVGQTHTFTVKVTNTLGGTPTGIQGVKPTVTLTPSNGASVANKVDNCATTGTDANGECTVTFTSPTAGVITGHAAATVVIEGTTFSIQTDGVAGNSGDAVKRFVDARIMIAPDDTNEVGQPHTFTVTVTRNIGDGNGFAPAEGANVTVTLTGTNGATPDPAGPFTGTTNANGQFQVTFTSATAGLVTGHATATLTVQGVNLSRQTNGQAGNSGDAVKRFVDARIMIAPDDTNEVGQPHTFTVTVTRNIGDGNGFAPAEGANVTVTLTGTNGATPDPAGPFTGTTNANGQFQVTFTSATAGLVTGHATATLTVQGVNLSRQTNGQAGNSGDAVKRFVDARIMIAPDDTNEVGQPHTFTVTVTRNIGDGNGFAPAEGANVTVTLTGTNGATPDPAGPFTGTTNANGQFQVTFTSATAGLVTGHATATLTVQGVNLSRQTNGQAGNSGDAVKRFVDARIMIAPDDTNEVGQPHTFTVTVTRNIGDGNGFAPAEGANVTVTLTGTNGATPDPAGPFTGTTNANGQFQVTFTSATAGLVTGHATATLTVQGVNLSRQTNGQAGNSGDAVKRFVDAFITINPPVDTNNVGDPHTFTVFVGQDDGLPAGAPGDGATGFGPAPIGTQVTVTLTNDATSNFQIISNTCAVLGLDANGMCTITFTSPTAGTVTGHAAVTFSVGGVSLNRETDGQAPNSGDAIKEFLAGSISWTKVDDAGRLQGGATFRVCRINDFIIATGVFGPDLDPPVCIPGDVADNGPNDQDPAAGKFTVSGLPLGRYTVKEIEAPPGYVPDPDTVTVELVPGHTSDTIELAFVNNRPVLKITGFSYDNSPDGLPQPDGIFKGTTTYTVKLHNYGTAAAVLSNSSLQVSPNATCTPASPLAITGTIPAGADGGPYTLTCTYDHPDPATITATLNVKYTTNGLERTASGSPATISFTVNPD